MNLADAFLNVLGVCFSGLLTGLAYLIYQHKFMKDRIWKEKKKMNDIWKLVISVLGIIIVTIFWILIIERKIKNA